MKRFLLCLLGIFACHAFSAETQGVSHSLETIADTVEVRPTHLLNRGGFIFQISIGVQREHIFFDQDAYFYTGKIKTTISGMERFFSLKLGGISKGLVSYYGTYDVFKTYFGKSDFNIQAKTNQKYKTIENYSTKDVSVWGHSIGTGIGVYPFRNETSPFFGFFCNLYLTLIDVKHIHYINEEIQIENLSTSKSEKSREFALEDFIYYNTTDFVLEIGKDWRVKNMLFCGMALKIGHHDGDSRIDKDDGYYDPFYKTDGFHYGFEIHFTWR